MTGFLLDTNVASEISYPQPNAKVLAWLESVDNDTLYLSVITIGDIRRGINRLEKGKRRTFLENWFTTELRPWSAGRILPVTDEIADRWGALDAQQQRRGRPLNTSDGLIAATSLEHGLIVVTRNLRDFHDLGAGVVDPWNEA